jgi:hypothetical protein
MPWLHLPAHNGKSYEDSALSARCCALSGAALPLHIFEDRYKEMIAGCLERKEPFGVVRAKRMAGGDRLHGVHRNGLAALFRRPAGYFVRGRRPV